MSIIGRRLDISKPIRTSSKTRMARSLDEIGFSCNAARYMEIPIADSFASLRYFGCSPSNLRSANSTFNMISGL